MVNIQHFTILSGLMMWQIVITCGAKNQYGGCAMFTLECNCTLKVIEKPDNV